MTQMARISAGRLTRTVGLGATLVIAMAGVTAAPVAAATIQISGLRPTTP